MSEGRLNMSAKTVQAIWSAIYDGASLNIKECATPGDYSAVHDHPELQITIVAGRSCMQASSSTDCGQPRHKRVSAGEICVTPSSQPHSMDWDETGGSMIVWVPPHFVVEALECTGQSLGNFSREIRYTRCIRAAPGEPAAPL